MANIICGADTSGCLQTIKSKCVIYDGPSTATVGYVPNMNLTQILLLIDEAIGNISTGSTVIEESSTTFPEGSGTDFDPYTINVKISDDPNNALTESNGLYVPIAEAGIDDANNGLSLNGSTVELGGTLNQNTHIALQNNNITLEGNGLSTISLSTAPLAGNFYQQIVMSPANWLQIANLSVNQGSVMQLGSNFLSMSCTDNADGPQITLDFDTIDIIHRTSMLPTTVNQFFLDGRLSGANAINPNEFITLAQLNDELAEFTNDFFSI